MNKSTQLYENKSNIRKEYYQKLNLYYEKQYRGATQNELDRYYEYLVNFYNENKDKLLESDPKVKDKLITKDDLKSALTAVTIAFAQPYNYIDEDIWV